MRISVFQASLVYVAVPGQPRLHSETLSQETKQIKQENTGRHPNPHRCIPSGTEPSHLYSGYWLMCLPGGPTTLIALPPTTAMPRTAQVQDNVHCPRPLFLRPAINTYSFKVKN